MLAHNLHNENKHCTIISTVKIEKIPCIQYLGVLEMSNYLNSCIKITSMSLLTLAIGCESFAAPPKPPASTCNPADSSTIDKVTACISKTHLTSIMQQFQNISDSNPDYTFIGFKSKTSKYPPGSRDSGTPGDIASVKYISDYMKGLGYSVTVQSYPVVYSADKVKPIMDETSPNALSFAPGTDFSSAVYSGSGDVTAKVQAISSSAPIAGATALGCSLSDFAGFTRGNIALLQRGSCPNRDKVLNAIQAGAVGVITVNTDDTNTGNTLLNPDGMLVPVVAYIPLSVGQKLYSETGGVNANAFVHLKVDLLVQNRTTYNVIADSKYGKPDSVVVLGGHYDSIFGAGILDNASGVASMMEIAAAMKDTPTVNKIRYAFWGGEELNLFGSQYYVANLSSTDLNKIVYNLDFDVTATKNFTYDISDPIYGQNFPSGAVTDSADWKTNAVKKSKIAVDLFKSYMDSVGLPYTSRLSDLDIAGSDTDSFILSGIPIGSLVTGQGGGKTQEEASIFGGTAGSFDVCADSPYVFCDNMSNVDSQVIYDVTKAFAAVTVGLVYDTNLVSSGNAYQKGQTYTSKKFAP
jgi:Zn-dependent M28 family amino/carboxypeptidase